MIEPPSPEETERQREKNRKLREQLMRIQRPTEISVPQGEWCCCTTFLIAYHFANEVYGCISVCTIHYHSCVNGFLPGPPMMSYSLPPAAGSSTSSLASLEPASSLLPPLSSLSLQQSQPSLSLSQFRPPPQTSTILSSLTQPLPPPASSLLTRSSMPASQPLSLSSPSQPSSSIFRPLSQPPSAITTSLCLTSSLLTYSTSFVNYSASPCLTTSPFS